VVTATLTAAGAEDMPLYTVADGKIVREQFFYGTTPPRAGTTAP
jgi:hypothetical protein